MNYEVIAPRGVRLNFQLILEDLDCNVPDGVLERVIIDDVSDEVVSQIRKTFGSPVFVREDIEIKPVKVVKTKRVKKDKESKPKSEKKDREKKDDKGSGVSIASVPKAVDLPNGLVLNSEAQDEPEDKDPFDESNEPEDKVD